MSIRAITHRTALLFALAAVTAAAQAPPATQDPRDMGEVARKVYAQSLHEARDLIDRKQYAEAIANSTKPSTRSPSSE